MQIRSRCNIRMAHVQTVDTVHIVDEAGITPTHIRGGLIIPPLMLEMFHILGRIQL
jgi:hypothetical protein